MTRGPDDDIVYSLATVGCGRMGAFSSPQTLNSLQPHWRPITHLEAASLHPKINISGCCDVNLKSARAAAKKYAIDKIYSDVKTLLQENSIDILTIATRTPVKAEILKEAILAGVPAIHVEKPLCSSVSELTQLESLIDSHQPLATFGCIRRYLTPYKHAKEIVRSGRFGAVLDVHVEMGREPLLWALSHALELMLFYLGPARPMKVSGIFEHIEYSDKDHCIDNDPVLLSATILFDNGSVGRVGGTAGDAVTISSVNSTLEIFADGRELTLSERAEGSPYHKKTAVPMIQEDQPGGTFKALDHLVRAQDRDEEAITEVNIARSDMLVTQHLIFDLLYSGLKDGAYVEHRNHPGNIKILGLTNGFAA